MNGILIPLFITTSPLNPNTLIQEFRTWESEKNRTSAEDVLNSALILEDDNGCNGSTKQEKLLQFPSGEDKQGSRWRYDRRNSGPWVQPDQEREGENCRCGHPREENEESGGESTWD